VQLRNLRSGELIEGGTEIREAVPPGKYMAKLLENGVTVVKTTFDVSPGEKKRMDLLSREPTPFQQAFLDRIVGRTDARVPDFSETLGPTANWNPELWLAYLGAAHVLRDPGMYQRLGKIPLESLDDLNDGDSSLFVLASVDGPVPEVALSKGKNVQWVSMETVSGIPTLCQAKIPISSGATLFSIKFADLTPISYATCGLPNRVTLLIICKQPDAPPTVQQFLLTPARFQNHLPIELQWKSLPVSALKVVQFMSLAQTRFAQRKSVGPKQESKDSSVATAIWRTLLDAKWTDPILAVVALYDIVRQGSAKSSPYSVQSVLGNLERYFLDLPDVGILHRLLLKTSAPINGTPLFLEGLLASREASNTMALSPDRLDFNSVWTSWRDAVQGEELSASATLSASWS